MDSLDLLKVLKAIGIAVLILIGLNYWYICLLAAVVYYELISRKETKGEVEATKDVSNK